MKTKIEKGVVIVAVVLVLGLIARTFLLNNAKKPSEPEDETSVTGTVTPTRTAAPTDATATVTGQPDKTPTESAGPTEEPLPTATPTPHSLQEREVTPTLTPVPIIETPTPVPTEEPFATPMIPTPTMTEREKDDALTGTWFFLMITIRQGKRRSIRFMRSGFRPREMIRTRSFCGATPEPFGFGMRTRSS